MKIAFLYNVKHNAPSANLAEQEDLEFDSPLVIETITKAIEKSGHEVLPIEADELAYENLRKHRGSIDFVFNMAEGLRGDARESQVPLYCELLKIPYSHSTPTTHAISLDKAFTKMVLATAGVKVPQSVTIREESDIVPANLSFPVIVKPNSEGSSKGVLDKCVVDTEADLKKTISEISENYTKEVIVEEFIDGREFTVPVLGNKDARVFPIIEQKFDFLPDDMHKIASFELKWVYEDELKNPKDAYDCPAILTKEEKDLIESTSLLVYKTLNCRDCARLDYRMNRNGELYFIEINTLPGLNPDPAVISYFRVSAEADGISFDELILQILESALSRYPHLK